MKAAVKFELDVSKLDSDPDAETLRHAACACGVATQDIVSLKIIKRSLDARKKPLVKIVYTAILEVRDGVVPKREFMPPPEDAPEWRPPENTKGLPVNPVIVGAGPCGLFAALVLAEAGLKPVVIERGRDVLRRAEDIASFMTERKLNPESNYLYGEGGAGTWSDGKLFTRVRDPRGDYVMRGFVECGAPPDILYYSHPHIGSDKLPSIISALRNKIISLGGEFRWDTRIESVTPGERFTSLVTDNGKIDAPAAIIACGHSARSLIMSLASSGIHGRLKGFQVGCRIEHPQEFINMTQFAMKTPPAVLGAAEYLFSCRPSGRSGGATTFCMCPGGEVMPAVCEDGRLSTNGMSRSGRDGAFANSAIVTTIPEDTFRSPREAFAFLDTLEKKMFDAGGGDYSAPAQNAEDFVYGKSGRLPHASSYRLGLHQTRLDRLVPPGLFDAAATAIRHFDRTAPGFMKHGLLIGTETRVSSPVRFDRDPETLESSMKNLYIGGEGGGMAGGIVSAAIDGVKLAEAMINNLQGAKCTLV